MIRPQLLGFDIVFNCVQLFLIGEIKTSLCDVFCRYIFYKVDGIMHAGVSN